MPIHGEMPRPLLIIIGPSASGKSTAVRELHQRRVVHVHPTWTTRPRRPDESTGALEHTFITDARFDELEAAGFFLGTVALPGLPFRYALPRVTLGDDGPIHTVMARAPFIDLFAPYFPDRLVYEIDDTLERARERLVARGVTNTRSKRAWSAIGPKSKPAVQIASRCFVNDGTLDELVEKVAAALRADMFATSS